MQQSDNPFSEAFGKAVDLGNRIADTDDKADIWDIADGLLAGAVQYWLYSRQPCSDPECEECAPISTAEGRLEELPLAGKSCWVMKIPARAPENPDVGKLYPHTWRRVRVHARPQRIAVAQ